MIHIAICDDEITIAHMLRQKVASNMESFNESFKIDCHTDALELLQSPCNFDILLLDIQMPRLNGIELARKLREKSVSCALIFITVLEEHVFDAFEVEAIDYLCKPIDDSRLEKALYRALKRIRKQNEKCLFIQTMNWCKSVKISTICYCEVINRKIYLHTQNGIIDYYCKMEEVLKQLDYRFVRCHRSYLVNLDYLHKYENGQITLENGMQIPVSRLRRREFMEAMLHYMKKEAH